MNEQNATRAAGSSAPACSARMAADTGMRAIRRLCDEALDHGMGWPSFCAMIRQRLDHESAFVEMAKAPNVTNHRFEPTEGEEYGEFVCSVFVHWSGVKTFSTLIATAKYLALL